MRKMNRSATCVVGVIFYGSLKGGTMAVWLPFVLHAKISIPIWGLSRDKISAVSVWAAPSVKIIVVFQQADWLQLTASN